MSKKGFGQMRPFGQTTFWSNDHLSKKTFVQMAFQIFKFYFRSNDPLPKKSNDLLVIFFSAGKMIFWTNGRRSAK
jgi:hypothetical protein